MATISTWRNESGERLDQPRDQRHGRDEEDGHLGARGERDLGGELDVPAVGDDDRAAVLGRVPDDRDDHGGDEEVGEPDLVGEGLEGVDERLGDERRHDGRRREHDERAGEGPGGLRGRLVGDVHRADGDEASTR